MTAQPRPVSHPLEQPFETEIIIPQVNGMNVYKADLHVHTIFSDGGVTPDMRVLEAWYDGLDVIAITDHMEYRSVEKDMLRNMDRYARDEFRKNGAVNTNITRHAPDEHGILVDFNVAYDLATRKAADYGIMVIRGVEITRKEKGDYNVLFTTDNNAIYVFCCCQFHTCYGDYTVFLCRFEKSRAVFAGVVVCQRHDVQPVENSHSGNIVGRHIVVTAW